MDRFNFYVIDFLKGFENGNSLYYLIFIILYFCIVAILAKYNAEK